MADYAVINNNTVINTIVADSLEIATEITEETCVEYTDDNPAHIGLGYNGSTFEQPIVVEVIEEEPTE